ncbi:MAG: tetratricopeptide repeat protein [Deltaproteobacteria bacterium]|nr:tetratricopeptide repeat protein [Deltaproteobacteria bacterium]
MENIGGRRGRTLVAAGCAKPGVTGVSESQARALASAQDIEARSEYFYLLIVAEDAAMRGDFDRAREAYFRLAKLDPDNADIHRTLAALWVKDGNLDQAIFNASRAYALAPANVDNAVLLSGLYAAQGRLNDAIRVYREILARDPDHEDVPLLLSRLLILKKEFHDARTLLDDYIRRHPDAPMGHFERARIELLDDRCDAAEPYLDEAVRAEPQFELAELALGYCAEIGGADTTAIEHYERALDINPDNTRLRSHLVQMHLRGSHLEDAQRENEKLRLFDFDESDVRVNRGLILYQQGRFDEAVNEFDLVLAADAKNGQALYFKGVCLTRLNRVDEALRTYARIPSDHPLYGDALAARGGLLRRIGRLDEAAEHLRSALKVHPDDPYLMRTLALVVSDQGKVDEAVRMMRKAMDLLPNDDAMPYTLANILERAGRWEEGVELMEGVLDKDPDNADALNFIGYTLAEKDVDLDRAEDLLKRAVDLRPNDGYIADSYGWLLYKRAKYKEALVWLEKGFRLVPDEAVVAEHVGDCHMKMGNESAALGFYRLALDLHPEPDVRARLEKKVEDID